MTNATNLKTMKGKVLMMAVLLVALVAAAMATTAKPAHAGTCTPSASAPTGHNYSDGKPKDIIYFGTIACDVWVKELYLTAELQRQNANGGWSVVDSVKDLQPGGYTVQPLGLITCTAPYVRATYRTVSKNGYTIAQNGYRKAYDPKYSVPVSIVC